MADRRSKKRPDNRNVYTLPELVNIIVCESGGGHPDGFVPAHAKGWFESTPAGMIRLVVEWDDDPPPKVSR